MASPLKLHSSVIIFLCFCFFPRGDAQGPGCDLLVQEQNTGERYGSEQVFEVCMTCSCFCAMRNVRMNAPGFHSTLPVDPKMFRLVSGDEYLVYDGYRIEDQQTISFQYSGNAFVALNLKTFQLACRVGEDN